MTDQSSEGGLPPGWTVEVRVRKNGRRDKYYFAPSSGLKFDSRAKVFRYLNTPKVRNPRPGGQKIEGNSKRSAKKVLVEKAIAEGLPPGWIKEVKVTKKGRKTRRDALYTDPVSGYIFRSLKDACRYLETGELGRHAYKPKDKIIVGEELEDDNISRICYEVDHPDSANLPSVDHFGELLGVNFSCHLHGYSTLVVIWMQIS